jgi:Family of unknown function (DUF6152)
VNQIKKNPLSIVLVAALGLLLSSGRASAHHGANLFDMSKATELKGTITEFRWGNPHNQIFFDVTDEKGTAHWVAYTEPPLVMLERGWTVKSIKAGEKVTIFVFAAKNGAPVANLAKIVFADGKELVANNIPGQGRGAAAPPPAPER